jgi:peptidase E
MPSSEPAIVALGGGGFSQEDDLRLDRFILSLAGKPRPNVCFVATAGGDWDNYIMRFYAAFAGLECRATHLPLFRRTAQPLAEIIAKQDVVYVGGGNCANLLAVWRTHGLDQILRDAWQRGVVLAGVSAGAICWFESGVTDSFGPALAPLHDALGFLPGSFCPHFDGEPLRRPRYHELVGAGELPAGYAADDGVGLLFRGTTFVEAISSRQAARAFRVAKEGELEIVPRLLPAA